MEKDMNDQQFDALLAVLNRTADALEEIDIRLSMLGAAYVKLNDPDGWREAEEKIDSDEGYDLGGLA